MTLGSGDLGTSAKPSGVALANYIGVALVSGIFLSWQAWAAGAHVDGLSVALILTGAIVAVGSGVLALRLGGAPKQQISPLLALPIGATVSALVLMLISFATGWPASQIMALWSIAIAVALASLKWDRDAIQADTTDCIVVGLLGAIVVIWSHIATGSIVNLTAHASLPLWADYYTHGMDIAQLGDERAKGRGLILLAGAPVTFYHYAMYMLPGAALFAAPSSGLTSAVGVLLPLGLFLGAVGVFAFGKIWGGPLSGAVAILLLLLPDAASYGLKNGFFGFHWMIFTTPGAGYGIAAATGLVSVVLWWVQERSLRLALLGAVLAAALFFLRVHFFLWLAPVLAAYITLAVAPKPWRLPLVGGAVALTFVIMIFAACSGVVSQWWFSHTEVQRYLSLIHIESKPTAYEGFYDATRHALGDVFAAIIGALIVIPAAYGALIAMPLAAFVFKPSETTKQFGILALLLFGVMFFVTLLAPTDPWGYSGEFQHRAFAMVYALLAAMLSVIVFTHVGGQWIGTVVLGTCLLFSATAAFGLRVDPGKPHFAWGPRYYQQPIDSHLVAGGNYLERRTRPGDTLAFGPFDGAKIGVADPSVALVSLTNTPLYLGTDASRPRSTKTQDAIALARRATLYRIEEQTDAAAAFRQLKSAGITWYMWLGADGPRFDKAKARAVTSDGGMAIYHMPTD